MNVRENFLKSLEFSSPDWVPCYIGLPGIVISEEEKYKKKLKNIKKHYKFLFNKDIRGNTPSLSEGTPPNCKIGLFVDSWGCVWNNATGLSEGQVIKHPLKDWDNFKKYKAPDPLAKRLNEYGDGIWDWSKVEEAVKVRRSEGRVVWGSGERLFDRLYFLRGFENLMVDFATDNENLPKLIEMLWEYEAKLVNKWLEIGVDIIWFHTDIASQENLMISPEMFRKYLKPMFKDLFGKCRNAGVHVYVSTDGNVTGIVDDFIECGVSMHDPQAGAISNEKISKFYKGKICICLDLDRQKFPFYTPDEIDVTIKDSVRMLNSTKGGLNVIANITDPIPDMPIENIEAICEAFKKYCY